MKFIYFLFGVLCLNTLLFSQDSTKIKHIPEKEYNSTEEQEGYIDEISFWAKPVFKDDADRKRFLYLKRKVYKVWPYVQTAQKLYTMNKEEMSGVKKKRKVRKHNREIQDSLMDKYKKRLKKFSRTDGRVMMKLIHRQTGETIYNIVKESKSGWSAFWWNTQAGIFKLNMKDTLDVKNNRDDYFVEYITNNGINKGYLRTLD